MEETKPVDRKLNLLWILYPIMLIVFGFIIQHTPSDDSNINFSDQISRALGSAFVLLILPLLILGIRRIFTKVKLAENKKLLLFYGVSILLFFLSSLGNCVGKMR